MTQKQFFFILSLFAISLVNAQPFEQIVAENGKIPAEKIYIHTDCETYFQGDTLWFKVYVTDSRSGQLIPKSENIYVQIVGMSGDVVLQSVLLTSGGCVSGSFTFSENFKPGNYLVQAYTNYQLNFGSDGCFFRQIAVVRNSGSTRSMATTDRVTNMVAEVDFMPEGGVLLESVANLIAFKAIGKQGFGVNVKGTVKDEKGVVVTTFTSDYKGMGLFFLTPEPGKKYTAFVDGFPAFRYNFTPVKNAIKIQLVNHTAREVILNIAGNNASVTGKLFYVASMYRGEVGFYQSFTMDGINKVIKFESKTLKPGINRMVLLDDQLRPVSERLLFTKSGGVKNLMVETLKKEYGKREKINVKIADIKWTGEMDFSNLSVAVQHKTVVPENGFSKNILSHFWIDSELRGFVESSADLFNDTDISSEAKLRLVMLTNGYSRYFWNNAPLEKTAPPYMQEAGIRLGGIAKNRLTGQIISNGEITIAVQKGNEVAFMSEITDEQGNFTFPPMLFSDTAIIHFQAKKEEGGLYTEILVEPVFKQGPSPGVHLVVMKDQSGVNPELSALKYKIYTDNRKMKPKSKSGRSQTNQKISDGHFRLYKEADAVLEVGNAGESYDNVLDFMAGKVSGVDINGNDVRIRGTGTFGGEATPLFLMDGVPLVASNNFNLPVEVTHADNNEASQVDNQGEQVVQMVQSIPLTDIERVEVLKSPQNLSLFGTKGSNGVIAIYTKRGHKSNEKSLTRGIIETKVAGFAAYRAFYSPVFLPGEDTEENILFNTLLYWSPDVLTRNGIAELQFYSTDLTGDFEIIVEGVASDGKICIEKSEFTVK